jgi:molybdopterin-containing oxidoreductase family iron-sulfur binding subunit
MDENRRSFLKKIGCAALGVGCGFPLLGTGCVGSRHESAGADSHGGEPSTSQMAMVVDIQKCLQKEVSDACIAACREEHNLPTEFESQEREIKWIWREKFEIAFPEREHGITEELAEKLVLVLCNHCSRPACTKVCPTAATWKRERDGIVMMDMHRCIGCRYCVVACPYGSRSFNWQDARPDIEGGYRGKYPTRDKGVVEKCSFCAERVRDGRDPACVEAAGKVPGGEGALTFGDLGDEDSPVSRILREKDTICRSVGLGTRPNVYYIL